MKKISNILREAREEKGISIERVAEDTKIKKEFIEEIERGQFQKLPSESYAMGFVKNYAKYLGVSVSLAVPLFRREYEAKHTINIVPNFRQSQHKFNKQFFLNSKSFLIIATILIVGAYIFFQYSSLFFPPQLQVTSPKNGITTSQNIVEVAGKTDPYATVTVDGEEVYVSLQGTFRKSIYMFAGDNKVDIVAKNRNGRKSEKIINIKVK